MPQDLSALVERLRTLPKNNLFVSLATSDAIAALEAQAAEIARLTAERDKLKTVMIAAAEEIAAHWGAHCDAEGYGPQNLQRRLEEGIPSEYGYTAGAFAALRAERDALRNALHGYFEVADAAWVEICQEATKHGIKSMPILPGQAKALDHYNAMRKDFGPAAVGAAREST